MVAKGEQTMNKKTFERLTALNHELWKICNEEFCRRQAQKRKREEKKNKGEKENEK